MLQPETWLVLKTSTAIIPATPKWCWPPQASGGHLRSWHGESSSDASQPHPSPKFWRQHSVSGCRGAGGCCILVVDLQHRAAASHHRPRQSGVWAELALELWQPLPLGQNQNPLGSSEFRHCLNAIAWVFLRGTWQAADCIP